MENFKLEKFSIQHHLEQILDFCKRSYHDISSPAHVNMWGDSKNTLSHILTKTNRFNEPFGAFYFLLDDHNIIGCSGIHVSDFCDQVAVAGSRLWIDKNYRNKFLARDYFLPVQKKWAIEREIKIIALTFNEYNRNLIQLWKRSRLGENMSERKSHHLFYDNFNEVSFPVNVKFTKQWLIYEKLDPTFEYDWNLIKS
jgi:hypothetical protein